MRKAASLQSIYPGMSIPLRTFQVPTPATIANYNKQREPGPSVDRRLIDSRINHEGYYPTLQSVVSDLGLGLEKELSWKSYLSDVIHTSANPIAFRQSFYAKAHADRLDPLLCRALLLRCSQYARQRAVAKSQGIVTPHDLLSKAGGEGSRGAVILGHTKSGKPIYGAGHAKYAGARKVAKEKGDAAGGKAMGAAVADKYKNFTAQDHRDAHEAHKEAAQNIGGYGLEVQAHHMAGASHLHAAHAVEAHDRGSAEHGQKSLAKAGAGSRGGSVIGQTKSGRPVYAASHKNYGSDHKFKGWSKQDHQDAQKLHGDNYQSALGKMTGIAKIHERETGHAVTSDRPAHEVMSGERLTDYRTHQHAARSSFHASQVHAAHAKTAPEHNQKSLAKAGAAPEGDDDAPTPASYQDINVQADATDTSGMDDAAAAASDMQDLLGSGAQEGIGVEDLADLVNEYGPDLLASVIKAMLDDGLVKFQDGRFYGKVVNKSFHISRI